VALLRDVTSQPVTVGRPGLAPPPPRCLVNCNAPKGCRIGLATAGIFCSTTKSISFSSFRRRRPVEERVVGMTVQMDEGLGTFRYSINKVGDRSQETGGQIKPVWAARFVLVTPRLAEFECTSRAPCLTVKTSDLSPWVFRPPIF